MGRLFDTDGIRGVANTFPMDVSTVLAVGRATAYVLKREHKGLNRIIIGKDTRLSGYMVEDALTAGICSVGVDVLLTGPIPTPAVAFLARSMRCVAGIVITASHTTYRENGIKIFDSQGFKLSDALEAEIERLALSGELDRLPAPDFDVGRAKRVDDACGRYIEFCKGAYPFGATLAGFKIVLDCANGATYSVAPTIFRELGAEVTVLHASPNGKNINERCGSQFTADLCRAVVETGSDAGLAFDGDGDRLIAVDETGAELSGDHIIAVCASHMKLLGRLPNNKVVITPMSNLGLRRYLESLGIGWVDAPVGDRHVLELMRKENAVLGGEQSGHVIFRDVHTTGDGIITALQLLSVVRVCGQSLGELSKIVRNEPQRLINVEVASKPELSSLPAVAARIAEAEKELEGKGRVFVRYSGTQDLCRVMVEAASRDDVDRVAETVAEAVRSAIGKVTG